MFEAVSSRLWSLKCSSPDCIPGTVAVPEDKAAVLGTEAGCTLVAADLAAVLGTEAGCTLVAAVVLGTEADLVAADLAVSRRIPLVQTDLQSRVNNNCKSV